MLLVDNDLRLRAMERSDLPDMIKWENDTSLWNTSDTLVPFSSEVIEQFIEQSSMDIYSKGQVRFIIELSGRAIGAVDLFDFSALHMRAAVGILIYDKAHRGLGYASRAMEMLSRYAFSRLMLHQIYADVPIDNTPSLRLFERCGFEASAIRKGWIRRGPNSWESAVMMQLINES